MTAAATPSPRRMLTVRQAARLERLTEAAVSELREHGYEGLSVRAVAARCGVAPATAYTYFASKNHLVAEIFWRRLRDLPEVVPADNPEDALVEAMKATVMTVADDAEVAAACTVAVLAPEPEVGQLRDMIGNELLRRIEATMGGATTPELIKAVLTHWSGVFLTAGMGYATYAEAIEEMDRSLRVLIRATVG